MYWDCYSIPTVVRMWHGGARTHSPHTQAVPTCVGSPVLGAWGCLSLVLLPCFFHSNSLLLLDVTLSP